MVFVNPIALSDIQATDTKSASLDVTMAEPLSSLPVPPESSSPSTQKAVPIPWPQDIDDAAAEPANTTASEVEELFEEASNRVQDSWSGLQRSISRVASRVVGNMRYWRRERPFEVIAGVAIGAFVLGAALRVWRSHHE